MRTNLTYIHAQIGDMLVALGDEDDLYMAEQEREIHRRLLGAPGTTLVLWVCV
jgi:hypothetical protein